MLGRRTGGMLCGHGKRLFSMQYLYATLFGEGSLCLPRGANLGTSSRNAKEIRDHIDEKIKKLI